jgi:hypothetical protein
MLLRKKTGVSRYPIPQVIEFLDFIAIDPDFAQRCLVIIRVQNRNLSRARIMMAGSYDDEFLVEVGQSRTLPEYILDRLGILVGFSAAGSRFGAVAGATIVTSRCRQQINTRDFKNWYGPDYARSNGAAML